MDFRITSFPNGQVSLRARSAAARAWLRVQFGPSTVLQLARRAHDAGFDVRGGR